MLEDYAIALTNQSEGVLTLLGLGTLVVGFIVALSVRSDAIWSLRRVPYFIMTAAAIAFISAAPLAWLLTFEAMKNEILWVLTASMFLGIAAFGYVYGVLAHARSVNAYGDGSGAWMALVPFANLVLYFKHPLEFTKSGWAGFALNFVGVIFGFFLFGIGQVLTEVSDEALEGMARRVENDPELITLSIEGMLRSQGLEDTLRQMAAEVPSQRIDEVTTLLRVEGEGKTLRYLYEVSTDVRVIPISMRLATVQQNCTFEAMRPVIEAGATLEHVYRYHNGSEVGVITVTRQICGF